MIDAHGTLEPLEAPPIVEVACGFLFEPMPQIDPISIGAFWHSLKSQFPERALRYPVEDGAGQLTVGNAPPPMRAWMISATGETLLQVQRDRVFFNWRAVGPEYPRFSAAGGVRSQALEAFEGLSDYLDETFGCRPAVRAVEVLKIDMLEQGTHWDDHSDLARMFPALATVLAGGPLGHPSLNLRLAGEQEGCTLRLKVDLLNQVGSNAIRLETIARALTADSSVEGALSRANEGANQLFSWLIPKDQRETRFKRRQP